MTELAPEQTTERNLPSASRRSPHQQGDKAARAQVEAGCVTGPLAGASLAQSCDNVLTVWDVEMASGVVFCLSNPLLLFIPLRFNHPLSETIFFTRFLPVPSPLPSSRLISTRFLPICFFTSLTTLSPANAYKSPSSPHPPSASCTTWLPRHNVQSVGCAKEKCVPTLKGQHGRSVA
ncbi:hypothetical protein K443DRAFT_162759 [Laccaria amethystina LaAM-08-1]|uniref:Uncharacterized protein n=1 Tax=Laccaria amethystina LaAM-08-1 TaxID=1095629 RepID=A0A0C9XPQ9_9AGAR|nr:hypothetical protein K443DRAFT_162759 [Laccaria amethystina LaAM-08-1]